MLDSLKKLDKKFLYIFGGIMGLILLFVIIAVIMSFISGPGKNYQSLETRLVTSAEKYVAKEVTPEMLPDGESMIVSSETLVSGGYMKEMSKYISDTCTGQVVISNNKGLLNYMPSLTCTEYTTALLAEKIIEDSLAVNPATQYSSGLYEMDGEYVFRGANPKNYVSFGGVIWRIIKIDENGNLRLIKSTPEKTRITWDNKFNVEVNKAYGINDYEFSYILSQLNYDYSLFKEENRRRLIMHDVCVGSRAQLDYTLDTSIDCDKVLEGQYVSTLNITEVSLASLDENCNSIIAGSCLNYNYFSHFLSTAWSTIASADNTYQSYTITVSAANAVNNSRKNRYYWIVYVSGEERFISGTGTQDDPYIIE